MTKKEQFAETLGQMIKIESLIYTQKYVTLGMILGATTDLHVVIGYICVLLRFSIFNPVLAQMLSGSAQQTRAMMRHA